MDKGNNVTRLIDRRLEPTDWRTTRRENPTDYEQKQTAGRWGRILSYIIRYQNKHSGNTPTDLMIAKDTGLSPGTVQYHLREMQKTGLIIDNKGWPRRITVVDVAKASRIAQALPQGPSEVITEEAPVEDTNPPKTAEATKTRLFRGRTTFFNRAQQAAQAIIDHYDMYGQSPSVQWIDERVYGDRKGSTTGSMSNTLNQMVEKGWLHHEKKRHRDYALTAVGRAALFGTVANDIHTDMPVKAQTPKAEPEPPAPPPVAKPIVAGVSIDVRRDTSSAAPNIYATTTAIPQPKSPSPFDTPTWEAPKPTDPLATISDVDLVLALTNRGYKVTRP